MQYRPHKRKTERLKKLWEEPRKAKPTIFELLLCRILALAGAGCDYRRELADARELARVLSVPKLSNL